MYCRALLTILPLFFLIGCAAVQPTSLTDLAALSPGTSGRFFFSSAGGRAEAYLVRPPGGAGPFPLMLLLHGDSVAGMGAERVLPAARAFATEICYASLAVSLPGYGATEVAAGPLEATTRQVVLDALAAAKQLPWIDADRLYIYGFSRGAVVAAALIHELEGLKAGLLHSGAYDLARLYRETSSFWLRRSLNPNGNASPKLRNLLLLTENWRAPTLILHGVKDSLIPVSQAILLRDRLEDLGKPHRLILFPDHGHRFSLREIKDQAMTFLKDTGGSACSATGS